MTIKLILILILFFACAFLIVKFFGKLFTINLFTAMAWSFKPKGSKPFWPVIPGAVLFYIIFFILFYMYLHTPFQLIDLKKTHVGGLLGYRDVDLQAKVYNPSKKTYESYVHSNAPFPAGKFTETFEVVLLYKQPSSYYYQDTTLFSLPTNMIEVVIGTMMFLVTYLLFFVLAKEYIKRNRINIKLTHHFVLARFRELVGISPLKGLIIFLFIILGILILNLFTVHNLKNHYKDLFAKQQESLRYEVLQNVSPNDTLKGLLYRRFFSQESQTVKQNRASDRGVRNVSNKTEYSTIWHYTIEFKDLISVPVYLDLIIPEGSDVANELNRNFKYSYSVTPNELLEYIFLVNTDLSISLKK